MVCCHKKVLSNTLQQLEIPDYIKLEQLFLLDSISFHSPCKVLHKTGSRKPVHCQFSDAFVGGGWISCQEDREKKSVADYQ